MHAHLIAMRLFVPCFITRTKVAHQGIQICEANNAKPGEIIRVDVVKRDEIGKQILGGVAIEIHVV
jgi:hypothetical protein